jgi:hypothetical protein
VVSVVIVVVAVLKALIMAMVMMERDSHDSHCDSQIVAFGCCGQLK